MAAQPGGDAPDERVDVHDLLVVSLRTHLTVLGEELDQTRRLLGLVKLALGAAAVLMVVDGLAASPTFRRASTLYAGRAASYLDNVMSYADPTVGFIADKVPRLVAALTPDWRERSTPAKPAVSHRAERAAAARAALTPPVQPSGDSRATPVPTPVPAQPAMTLPDLVTRPKATPAPDMPQIAKLDAGRSDLAMPEAVRPEEKPTTQPKTESVTPDTTNDEQVAALPRTSQEEAFAEAFKSASRMLERRLTPEEKDAPIDPQYLDAVLRIEGIYDPTRIGPFGNALRMAVRPGTASMRNVFGDSWTRAVPDPNVHYRAQYMAQTWLRPTTPTCDDFWRFRPDNYLVRLDKLAPADCESLRLAMTEDAGGLKTEHVAPAPLSVPAFAAPYPGGRMSSAEMRAALQERIQAAEERLWFRRPGLAPRETPKTP